MPRTALSSFYAVLLAGGVAALVVGWLYFGAAGDAASGRYVEAVIGRPGPVNPLLARDDVAYDLVAMTFNGLMRITGDGTAVPDLAERWDVTPDGLTYTFVLRSDASWHDGHRVSADDVAFTVDQLQAPAFAGPPERAAPWSGVELFVADDRTVLFHLPQPSADFLVQAAVPLLPAHLLRDVAAAGLAHTPFNQAPVGTGPYRLTELDEHHARLVANTRFYRGAPAVREIELRFVRDREAQVAALRAGDANAALLDDHPDDADRAALDARTDLTAITLLRSAFVVLYANNQAPPLNDARLRRALLGSIDRAELFAGSGASGRVGDGVIVPGSWAYAPGMSALDTATVEGLWLASGWDRNADGARTREGQALTLELITNSDPDREALAYAIADQLAAWGVAIDVVSEPAGQLVQRRLGPRDYQLALFGWEVSADPDPYGGWHSSQISAQGRNIAGFHAPAADAALEVGRTTLDGAERRTLYAHFDAIFREQAASLVLFYPGRVYVFPRTMHGFADGLLFTPASRFRDVERWRFDAR